MTAAELRALVCANAALLTGAARSSTPAAIGAALGTAARDGTQAAYLAGLDASTPAEARAPYATMLETISAVHTIETAAVAALGA